MNQAFARRNHHEIESFLGHLLEQDQQLHSSGRKLQTCSGRPNIVCLAGNTTKTPTPMEKLRQMETGMVLGCSHYYQNFLMDIMGWPLVDFDPSKTDGWYVPYYFQVYMESLPVDEEEEDDCKPKKKERPKRSCFNCGGEHSLQECTEPRNQQRIREAMTAFKNSKANSSAQSLKSRYHEEDCEPRFSSFKPGVISAELREALGLQQSQLPAHIYMMRKLGYPPGWLEAAKEETSGLAVFDEAGKELDQDGDAVEEGEVSEANITQPKYNLEKLVDYPGFNCSMPEGVDDEHEKLYSIPMQPDHSKEALKLYLTPADGPPQGRKRKSCDNGELQSKRVRVEIDMDLDSSQTEEDGTNTPTLEDLEEKQRVLQMQLALAEGGGDPDIAVVDCADTDSQDEANSSFLPPVPPTPEQPPLPPGTPPVTPRNTPKSQPPMPPTPEQPPLPAGTPPVTPSFKTPLPVTPQTVQELVGSTRSSGGSIERNYGTPIHLERTPTPNKGLPGLAKFSEGVSQHIPFENLPDSTGNFKKLRTVLSDIRSKRDSL